MKANNSKILEKPDKKSVQKLKKKELENSIMFKFLEALKGLGYDAEKFSKEIKKSSKNLAKKISKKYSEVKSSVEEKITKKPDSIKVEKLKSDTDAKGKTVKPATIKNTSTNSKPVKKTTKEKKKEPIKAKRTSTAKSTSSKASTPQKAVDSKSTQKTEKQILSAREKKAKPI